MRKKEKKLADRVLHNECTTIPKSKGNGQLIRRVLVDSRHSVTRYNLA
jgi:hypothetical protein